SSESDKNTEQNNTKAEDELVLPDSPLQKGEEGEEVKNLQQTLKNLDYQIDITSQYDEETTWAVTDFQLQVDGLDITGFDDNNPIQPGEGITFEKNSKTKDGKIVTDNPYDVLVLVNKENALPEDFTPKDLVIPDVRFPFTEDLPKKQMRKVAADALEKMFKAA